MLYSNIYIIVDMYNMYLCLQALKVWVSEVLKTLLTSEGHTKFRGGLITRQQFWGVFIFTPPLGKYQRKRRNWNWLPSNVESVEADFTVNVCVGNGDSADVVVYRIYCTYRFFCFFSAVCIRPVSHTPQSKCVISRV